ncbi:MAG: hypothetical protein WAX69_05385 [Victivallales bacterium]
MRHDTGHVIAEILEKERSAMHIRHTNPIREAFFAGKTADHANPTWRR